MDIKGIKIAVSFVMAIILVFLAVCYFVPFHTGWRGEVPIVKFRFQVTTYILHDYGEA